MNSHDKRTDEKSVLEVNLKSVVIFLVLALAVYILIPKIINEKNTFSLILKVNKPYLLLALICELVSYIGAAALMGVILSRLGYKIAFKDRFRLGSIAAFAIHFFPVSGIGEGAVDYYFLRKRDVSAGSILLMFILRSIITYSSFLILFVIVLLTAPAFPNLGFSPRVISLILFILISFGVFYLTLLYKNKDRFHKVMLKIMKPVNHILAVFKKKPIAEEKINETYLDLHKGIGLFADQKRSSLAAILSGLVYWLGDIMCLFFVILSLGYTPNLGLIIFGYCIATLAGIISLIPGGLGVTDGTMSLILRAIGMRLSLAVTSVLVFRFFSFWIWIPIGLVSYITLKRGNKKYETKTA